MLNVDLGYLTFKLAFGGYESWQYKNGSQVAIAAVDNKPKRKELYPQYKQYRNAGEDKQAVVKMVWKLRKQVEQEKLLPLCSIEGLEADDLVACWQLFNPDNKIVGVDKDFFQLPIEQVYYHTLKPYNVIDTIGKLPQFVQPIASRNFALYQILMGDVADNIPRLLAKHSEGKEQLEFIEQAIRHNHLTDSLTDLYGQQVVLNAQLVLLPYFAYCESSDWFDCWCSGHYYDKNNWNGLYQQMKSCLGENKVTQDNEVWNLFSLA